MMEIELFSEVGRCRWLAEDEEEDEDVRCTGESTRQIINKLWVHGSVVGRLVCWLAQSLTLSNLGCRSLEICRL